MNLKDIPYQTIDWATVPRTEHGAPLVGKTTRGGSVVAFAKNQTMEKAK